MEGKFEHIGFSKDYYLLEQNNPVPLYFGTVTYVDRDRESMGYRGRRLEVTKTEVLLTNKKVIKPGTEVITELQIICGRSKEELKTVNYEER